MAETRTLSITASRAEDAAVPADAVLDVELLDVSRADAPATVVASQRFRVKGWPVLIRLPYDSGAIDPRMTYRVAARLVSGDTVILRTTSAYPVLTRNAPGSARIELVDAGARKSAPRAHPGIAGVPWAATELGGRALIADDPPTIAFLDDGAFSMYGGCNRFRGKARLSDGRIVFSDPIAGTRMMCPPPRMKLESDMLAALRSTTGYLREGSLLVFTNGADVAVARFREAPD